MAKRKLRKKKLFIDLKKEHWVKVLLYDKATDMQRDYKKYCKKKGLTEDLKKDNFKDVQGVHCAHYVFDIPPKKKDPEQTPKLNGYSGVVFLHTNACGGGVIAHEFGHAVLWILGRKQNYVPLGEAVERTGYPITINNMEEEEDLLYNLYHAVRRFYNWYWKVCKEARA